MKILLKDLNGEIHVVADSAMARSGQPWFVPDFGCNWRSRRAVALRVSRLGKEISRKFVGRYFDSVTVLWVAEADDCAALDFMDGRMVCGNWLPVSAAGEVELPIDFLIEASHFATLKTGDVVAVMLPDDPEPIATQGSVSIDFMGENILKFNVK